MQNKTEPPTARRLRRARRDGDHPVSRALIGVGALACVAVFGPLCLDALLHDFRELLQAGLRGGGEASVRGLAVRMAWLVSPITGAAALGALLVGMWQTGGVVSAKPLAWDSRRLHPFARARESSIGVRFFSALSFLAVAGLLGIVAWRLLHAQGPGLAASVGNASAAARALAELWRGLALWALAVTLAVAVADALVTRRAWYARHRMTREEVRLEQRESEGDAGIKQARQRAHQELAKNSQATQLDQCTLLVLGSARLAIALFYDPARDAPPRVVMQASGALAKTLEALAPSYGVPIHYDPSLARSLASLGVDEDIPKAQYAAVAEVLERLLRSGSRDGSGA